MMLVDMEGAEAMDKMDFHIERYRGTRFFGLYCNGSLLCVTVHKKGAIAVWDKIQSLLDANKEAKAPITELLEGHQFDRGGRTDHV
jgi:hypothetical protein